jgi:hypothetical protein
MLINEGGEYPLPSDQLADKPYDCKRAQHNLKRRSLELFQLNATTPILSFRPGHLGKRKYGDGPPDSWGLQKIIQQLIYARGENPKKKVSIGIVLNKTCYKTHQVSKPYIPRSLPPPPAPAGEIKHPEQLFRQRMISSKGRARGEGSGSGGENNEVQNLTSMGSRDKFNAGERRYWQMNLLEQGGNAAGPQHGDVPDGNHNGEKLGGRSGKSGGKVI